MSPFELYIAYVAWGGGGKRRPVLVLERNADEISVYPITSQFLSKSESVRAKYLLINDWKQSGLEMPSYIDTNKILDIEASEIDSEAIGKLSNADIERFLNFIGGKLV